MLLYLSHPPLLVNNQLPLSRNMHTLLPSASSTRYVAKNHLHPALARIILLVLAAGYSHAAGAQLLGSATREPRPPGSPGPQGAPACSSRHQGAPACSSRHQGAPACSSCLLHLIRSRCQPSSRLAAERLLNGYAHLSGCYLPQDAAMPV